MQAFITLWREVEKCFLNDEKVLQGGRRGPAHIDKWWSAKTNGSLVHLWHLSFDEDSKNGGRDLV